MERVDRRPTRSKKIQSGVAHPCLGRQRIVDRRLPYREKEDEKKRGLNRPSNRYAQLPNENCRQQCRGYCAQAEAKELLWANPESNREGEEDA
jgi:hypothetical protein